MATTINFGTEIEVATVNQMIIRSGYSGTIIIWVQPGFTLHNRRRIYYHPYQHNIDREYHVDAVHNALIIGCGDIGKRIARQLLSSGMSVGAMTRSVENRDRLAKMGLDAFTGDLDDPETIDPAAAADAIVFYLAPPPGGGFHDTRMRNFCAALKTGARPAKVVYMSTSGVYGDCPGIAVTEETPLNPQTARARRRLDAETTLAGYGAETQVPIVILRVTGIYGPNRLPITHLMNGVPLLNENEAPTTNRIHADDLATVCIAAAARGENGEIFNVSDGEHGTMTAYFTAIADLLGIPRPRQVSREEAAIVMPPLLYSYFSESRRMDNRKMLTRLGVSLRYPTLADGLKSCIPEGWKPPETNKIQGEDE